MSDDAQRDGTQSDGRTEGWRQMLHRGRWHQRAVTLQYSVDVGSVLTCFILTTHVQHTEEMVRLGRLSKGFVLDIILYEYVSVS